MKRVFVTAIFLLATGVGPAMADCSSFGGAMSSAQITSLLKPGTVGPTAVYTCYNPGTMPSTRENNETLFSSNQFQEYHSNTAKDPVQTEGTYSITTIPQTNIGQITYNYMNGQTIVHSYTYQICATATPDGTKGNIYQFVNGTTNLPIVVSTGPGTC